MADQFTPTLYTRHQRPLRALVLECQVWFPAQDLGRLMGKQLDERQLRKLDSDQYRQVRLTCNLNVRDTLMISESGAYALLVYHYAPENRALRQWLSHEVIPTMHANPETPQEPQLNLLEWSGLQLCTLIWQGEPWIRWRDAPSLAQVDFANDRSLRPSKWQRFKDAFSLTHWKV